MFQQDSDSEVYSVVAAQASLSCNKGNRELLLFVWPRGNDPSNQLTWKGVGDIASVIQSGVHV